MSWLLAYAALAAAPPVPPMPAPPSLAEARRLSAQALALRVLGPAGALYADARVYGDSPFGPRGLSMIVFSTPPRSGGWPGLCTANELLIRFTPVDERAQGLDDPVADPPTRIHGISTSVAYRIVGDAGRREWTDAYARTLDAQCAGAGPVLAPVVDRAGDAARFFAVAPDASATAYFAARTLQQALADVRAGTLTAITCAEDPGEPGARACADPRALLVGLGPERIIGAGVAPCAAAALQCVTVYFSRPDMRGDAAKSIAVEIRVEAADANPLAAAIRPVAASIRHSTIVEN